MVLNPSKKMTPVGYHPFDLGDILLNHLDFFLPLSYSKVQSVYAQMAALSSETTPMAPDAGDGLDNKERWHWKERDLRGWVGEFLDAAFVCFNHGLLFHNASFRARCTTIRADYEDDGECFLNWRKGECFATYSFGVRLEFLGSVFVGGRSIGQSKGVVWVRDINHNDEEEESWPTTVLGAWEVPALGQRPIADEPGKPTTRQSRAPVPFEQALKDAVQKDAMPVIRMKLRALRAALAEVATEQRGQKGKLLDAGVSAENHMQKWQLAAKEDLDASQACHGGFSANAKLLTLTPMATAGARGDETSQRNAQEDASITSKVVVQVKEEAIDAQAAASAQKFVDDLRAAHRSERFKRVLQKPTGSLSNDGSVEGSDCPLATMRVIELNLCDIRGGRDVADLVDALERSGEACKAETLDLRDNRNLDDSAIQPLLLSLAARSKVLPCLKLLRLSGTSATIVSKNMCKGLELMRKGLTVDFGS